MIQTSNAAPPALTDVLRTERSNALRSRILQIAASIYQLIALIAFIVAIFFATSWLKLPFLGAFLEQTNVFNAAKPGGESDTWFLYNQGIRFGDRLLFVNGVPVRNATDLPKILVNFFPGETIPVAIQKAGGQPQIFQVKLDAFPSRDR